MEILVLTSSPPPPRGHGTTTGRHDAPYPLPMPQSAGGTSNNEKIKFQTNMTALVKNRYLHITILGFANFIMAAFIGSHLMLFGAAMTLTPGGQGLQAIFGLPLFSAGTFLLYQAYTTLYLVQLREKGRKNLTRSSIASIIIILFLMASFLSPIFVSHPLTYIYIAIYCANLTLFLPKIKARFTNDNSRPLLAGLLKKEIIFFNSVLVVAFIFSGVRVLNIFISVITGLTPSLNLAH